MNSFSVKNILGFLWRIPMLLLCVGFVSWLYTLTIWYGSVLVVSFIAIVLFPLLVAIIYRAIFSNYLKPLGFKSMLIAFVLIAISTWFYWVFWFDMTLNQSSWVKIESQFLPIDYFKATSSNLNQCLYLFTHPDRLISFLSVYYDHGYFSLFGFRLKGYMLLILSLCEYTLGGCIIFHLTKLESEKVP